MARISSGHADPKAVTGCSWEEKPIGGSRVVRCGDTVMPGKPWCVTHWTRFQRGKTFLGRSRFSQNGS
jgi:hypothetical protein